ncbi:MAG: EVE domain-containing protein [Leptospiraceae bacterium]|nr:EVE domain-containing protein [Leptospiraceae bacterium]
MQYWLFKSEPDVFSIEDLKKSKNGTASWEGVRNFQARNFLRDDVKKGNLVLFYHSRVEPMAVAGVVEVVKEGYLDHFAFDPDSKYYDPKSKKDKPQWYMVDVKFKSMFKNPVTLKAIKTYKELSKMRLIQKGSRLSIQPITKEEFDFIVKLGG